MELVWAPINGLTISQNIGYKAGEYDEYFAVDSAATVAANLPDDLWGIILLNDRPCERLSFSKDELWRFARL